jgi:hypothetical protein
MTRLALSVLSASLLASASSHASPGGRIAGSGAVTQHVGEYTVRQVYNRPVS